MNEVRFQLRDVSFAYDREPPVFDTLSFELRAGERVGLTGPNGAGKTTFLQLLVGLHLPRAGELIAYGRPRRAERDFHDVRLRTGLLFQDPDDQLFCATVAEDVAFGPFNLGWPRERIRAAVSRTLAALGLAGYETKITHHLSHGEKRLVCLATILAMEPDVLLLDEPTEGLDAAHRALLLAALGARDAAMLIASHDRNLLDTLATRTVHLEGGALLAT